MSGAVPRLCASLVALTAALVVASPPSASAGAPVFVVTGRGWGHGVGLSQWGARGYAVRGWRHEGILAHYYPGTRLAGAPVSRVRVLLAEGRTAVRIGSKRAYRVEDATGRRVSLPGGGRVVGASLVLKVRGKALRLKSPLRFTAGAMPLRLDQGPYRGDLVVRSRGGRLSVVNELGLERYIRGVVPWEMPHDWPLEALKAQAVIARSYALATRRTDGIYDLLPDTRDQVYGGLTAEKPESNRAVAATAGRVLWFGNEVATTYYHSTSGGRTAAVWEVWPGFTHVPYLRAVWSPYEAASPKFTWGPYVLSARRLASKLRTPVPRDATVERNGSGRATALVVGGRRVPAQRLQDSLGLGSGWFTFGVLRLDSSTPAVYGRRMVVSGVARDISGAALERREGGRWRAVARIRSFRSGIFRVPVRALGTELRLAGRGAATAPMRVPLAPSVELRDRAGALHGSVRPSLAGARVRIQQLTATGWTTVANLRVDGK